MARRLPVVALLVVTICPGWSLEAQSEGMAVVHLKVVLSVNGEDLGPARIAAFKSRETGKDYSAEFRNNTIAGLPYGLYDLRVFKEGYASLERVVRVYQPQVWVVAGLHLGDLLLGRYAGAIQDLPKGQQEVWIRFSSLRANVIIDARVESDGNFTISGVPPGVYVLTVWTGPETLHIGLVRFPTKKPLVVDLSKPIQEQ